MGMHLTVSYTYGTLTVLLKSNNAFRLFYYLLQIRATTINVGFKTAQKEIDNPPYSAVYCSVLTVLRQHNTEWPIFQPQTCGKSDKSHVAAVWPLKSEMSALWRLRIFQPLSE